MCMAIFGGAVLPPLMGRINDTVGLGAGVPRAARRLRLPARALAAAAEPAGGEGGLRWATRAIPASSSPSTPAAPSSSSPRCRATARWSSRSRSPRTPTTSRAVPRDDRRGLHEGEGEGARPAGRHQLRLPRPRRLPARDHRRPRQPAGASGGGVALGPMLEDRFGVPVFINNDGDLFAFGEAIAGLPAVGERPPRRGRQPQALPQPLRRDLRHRLRRRHRAGRPSLDRRQLGGRRDLAASATSSTRGRTSRRRSRIRAVRRVYAQEAGIAFEAAPEPKEIFAIGKGEAPGHREAAVEAFRRHGRGRRRRARLGGHARRRPRRDRRRPDRRGRALPARARGRDERDLRDAVRDRSPASR